MIPVSDERLADLIHRTRLAAEVSGDAGYIGDEIASIMRELQHLRIMFTSLESLVRDQDGGDSVLNVCYGKAQNENGQFGITRSDAYGAYVTHEVSGPSLVEAFNALVIAPKEAGR